MNGILVVDKPSGPTSHDICQYFKRTLPVKRVGHAGTLDPMATGVLVILLDGATKLQSTFMGQDKEYAFTMRLGVTTDTYDREGKIVSQQEVPHSIIDQLPAILPEFTGEIWQTPPPFSAIKKNGTPLYKLARQGKSVHPEPRKVKIHSLDVVKISLPDVSVKIRCSCGTYVRALAHDIGQQFGCGAHVTALRRLRSGSFTLREAMALDRPFASGSAKNRSAPA